MFHHGPAAINVALSRAKCVALVIAVVAIIGSISALRARNVMAHAADAKSTGHLLSYNDGTADGKKSLGGTGELISFTLPDEGVKVAGIRIHGSRYGTPQAPKENFMIYFLNADMSETVATRTAPYSLFKKGAEQWVDVKFPKPIELPKDFWVGLDFRAHQTKGVYVSIDSSTDGEHSRVGLPGIEARKPDFAGDWMIEVALAK
jgi:RNA polymerase sigma-70 factor (ECF subfamily)